MGQQSNLWRKCRVLDLIKTAEGASAVSKSTCRLEGKATATITNAG